MPLQIARLHGLSLVQVPRWALLARAASATTFPASSRK